MRLTVHVFPAPTGLEGQVCLELVGPEGRMVRGTTGRSWFRGFMDRLRVLMAPLLERRHRASRLDIELNDAAYERVLAYVDTDDAMPTQAMALAGVWMPQADPNTLHQVLSGRV